MAHCSHLSLLLEYSIVRKDRDNIVTLRIGGEEVRLVRRQLTVSVKLLHEIFSPLDKPLSLYAFNQLMKSIKSKKWVSTKPKGRLSRLICSRCYCLEQMMICLKSTLDDLKGFLQIDVGTLDWHQVHHLGLGCWIHDIL